MDPRKVIFVGIASAIFFVSGCSDKSPNDVKSANPTGNELVDEVFANHEIDEAALEFSRESVEQRLIETQKWGDLDLEITGTGKYKGDATTKDGTIFNVEVRQTTEGIYTRWTSLDKSGGGSAIITW